MELVRDIRSKLKPMLGASFSRLELNDFVALCHALAVVALKCRSRSLYYLTHFQFADSSDVAYECISDLFNRDAEGNLLQLKAYFEGIDIDRSTDQDLLVHLRRLVFGKVNVGLFRILNELDPALGKILRNIKLAVQTLQNFTIVERFGDQCLVPALSPTLEHLPVLSPEEIARELHRAATRAEHVPGLLAKLSHFLRDQEDASRVVPVMVVALAIRLFYEKRPVQDAVLPEVLDRMHARDADVLITRTCDELRTTVHKKYVGSNKVTQAQFDQYFAVIRRLLVERIVEGGTDGIPLYERLRQQLPGLTREAYRASHRAKLEYLARLAEKRVTAELQRYLK